MICRWIKSPVLDWMNKFFWIQLVANCIGFMNIGMTFQVFFTMETFQTNFLLSVHCRKKQDRHQCRARYLTSFHVINSYRLIRRWRKNWNCLVNDFVTSIVNSLFGPVISCRTWSISLLLFFRVDISCHCQIPIRKCKSNDNRPPVHRFTIRIVREKKTGKWECWHFENKWRCCMVCQCGRTLSDHWPLTSDQNKELTW